MFSKEKQATASAVFGIGIFIGPTIGPTLGGYTTENYSWPSTFYINIPIGIIAALSCLILLYEPVIRQIAQRIDWLGIALLVVGVGALQTVLERGVVEDWFETNYISFLAVLSAISLILFIVWELQTDNPVVNLRILKQRSLSIAAILTSITGIGMYTSIYLTPVVAQRLMGFTPTQSGLLLLPGSIVALLALMMPGKLLQRGVSPAIMIAVGFLSFIYFNWSMSRITTDSSSFEISLNLIFRAIGMSLLTVPLGTQVISSLQAKDMPQGTALNNMMRQLGGSFGISIVNTYVIRRIASHRMDMVTHITADNILTTQRITAYTNGFLQKGYLLTDAKLRAMALMEKLVQKQSAFSSYLNAYLLIGLFFLMVLPFLFLVAKRDKTRPILIASSEH